MNKNVNVTEIYGSNVFNDSAMRERLPKKIYEELKKTIENGEVLNENKKRANREGGRK